MINYKKLTWSNCFSYGENCTIDFQQAPVLQLVGKNGHGKSSIALILEEVLFNKNSKGIKKQNILNRHAKTKRYQISLEFSIGSDEYRIDVTRSATQQVALFKNGVDVSHHTATATFKAIEDLIGYDHKTFSQIVYQSSSSALEFLTTTDTQRKKFLIDLLDLGIYTKYQENVKATLAEREKELAAQEAKIMQYEGWISRAKQKPTEKLTLLEVPPNGDALQDTLAQLEAELKQISATNKRIQQNLVYKSQFEKIKLDAPTHNREEAKKIIQESKDALRESMAREARYSAQVAADRKQLKKLNEVKDHCPTCGAKLEGVNTDHLDVERARLEVDIQASLVNAEAELEEQKLLQERITLNDAKLALWVKYDREASEYEKYHELYDRSMPLELLDAEDLEARISALRTEVAKQRKRYTEVQEHNAKVAQHNAGVDSLLQQLVEYESELQELKDHKAILVLRTTNLNILAKAFSTNGLLAYKIECMIKDLENLTNEYLQQMSDGRFQLRFEIGGSDKLNVIITDNGSDVEILALSSGERARVNTSCLLAIRKLLQSISSTRSNLLILDETIENLDLEGKERLIEVLLSEPDLNTVLVSHSFSHPLIMRLNVIKERNFSRIDNG